ncbi:MAG: YARHG domain-containing protein [Peptococcaceae bacterium]|nr:YARHG domain-containing protein [Peptococcaceae bacterium]
MKTVCRRGRAVFWTNILVTVLAGCGAPAVKLPAASHNTVLYPWTASRPVTTQDLQGLSRHRLDIMRNEIYARHGWIFQTPFWKDYFAS